MKEVRLCCALQCTLKTSKVTGTLGLLRSAAVSAEDCPRAGSSTAAAFLRRLAGRPAVSPEGGLTTGSAGRPSCDVRGNFRTYAACTRLTARTYAQ